MHRVQASIAALGYSPSVAARSLVHGRNDTIAMVVPDLENPLFQGILKGLSLAAASDGYRVLVADTGERVDDEEATAIEARHRCDALVLCAPRMPEQRLRRLVSRVAPVVVVNRPLPDADVPIVGVDYVRGIRDLVDHLHGLGHRRIAYVSGPASSASNAERLRGVAEATARPSRRAHRRRARRFTPRRRLRRRRGGARRARRRCHRGDRLQRPRRARPHDATAPSSASTCPATSRSRASTTCRWPASRRPRLTSMSVPRGEIGAQVWARLRTLIAGGPIEHTVLYRPRLEARDSTGPVR